ncbi:MAG: hypothetical protein K1X53_13245 [Candidatus Sumerlaeaceae bacterium]|nr:hypothetical protein [Candidatus Sumerlaeaceae bacterium]
MKTLAIFVLSCSIGFQAHAQLDTNLTHQIRAWRKGDAPPARLLKFPDGKIDTIPGCDLRVIGSEVGDYISEIQDADLLAALMFDYRSQPDTFHAAVSRLITLKGVDHVSRILAERRKTEPGAFTRSELAVLSQLVRAPYIAVQVARIAPEDMPTEKADTALQAMRTDLQAGASWADAYRKHSDLHPDMRDRAKDPKSVRTLVCYLYDSTVSPSGFDIVTYSIAESLPLEHLRELFRAKRGTHIFRAADGVYLYHVRSYYDDAS